LIRRRGFASQGSPSGSKIKGRDNLSNLFRGVALIKKVFFTGFQFVLFLVAFAAGSFFPPFRMEQVLAATNDGTRVFIWDGVVLMAILFAVILVIEALRKRIGTSGLWTTTALALAAIAGYTAKLGFLTR
jgi:hypothetical protein